MEVEDILSERGNTYGTFEDNSKFTQFFKAEVRSFRGWSKLTSSKQESVDMIIHKVSRIMNGDHTWLDSWYDIIGYAQLVVNQPETFQAAKLTKYSDNANRNMIKNATNYKNMQGFYTGIIKSILDEIVACIDDDNLTHWKSIIQDSQLVINDLESQGVARVQR